MFFGLRQLFTPESPQETWFRINSFFVNSWSWENMFRSFASNRPSLPLCTTFHKHKMTYTRKRGRHLIGSNLCPFEILWISKEVWGLPPGFLIKTHGAMNFANFNHFNRGCQHPSHKFEILWQTAQDLISLLLSHFGAQYVLIIVV